MQVKTPWSMAWATLRNTAGSEGKQAACTVGWYKTLTVQGDHDN